MSERWKLPLSRQAAGNWAGVQVAAAREMRALSALTFYPLVAMTRNLSTLAFGFLFPVVFIAVFGLIGGGGPTLRLGIPAEEAAGPLFAALEQVPSIDFTQADDRELQ